MSIVWFINKEFPTLHNAWICYGKIMVKAIIVAKTLTMFFLLPFSILFPRLEYTALTRFGNHMTCLTSNICGLKRLISYVPTSKNVEHQIFCMFVVGRVHSGEVASVKKFSSF